MASTTTSATVSSPSSHNLDLLFPAPSRFPPSSLCPTPLAGHTDDSVQTLRSLLKHNHEFHHIFYNNRRFNNHVAHHLLAIYALGANSNLLKAGYEVDKSSQRPSYPSPGLITAENYVEHLGNDDYFQAYLTFFETALLEKGVTKTLEEYLYSKKANYDDQRQKEGKKQPEMLSRLLSGLIHPMIHLGYGLEFGLLGIVAESLAQTAVHGAHMAPIIPASYWDDERHTAAINNLIYRASSLALNRTHQINGVSPTHSSRADEVTAFNILALMQKDESLSSKTLGPNSEVKLYEIVEKLNETIRMYSEMWSLNIIGSSNVQHEVQRKIEELAWTCAVMYGLGGWSAGDKPFRADFILMHLVTSSLFLPSIVAYLPPHAVQILLRTYFSTVLGIWIIRGRPILHITKEFITSTTPSPQEPIKSPYSAAKDTLTPDEITPNPWLAITQSVLQHPDDHMCKTQRSLMHWATLFGTRPAGYWVGGTEQQLEGIELLDGTIFARVAGLTADRLGWMREGQEHGEWNFSLLA